MASTKGTLYVVSTPIGNLEDITLRALRTLREVKLIAAEDTRHTRKLLNHFEINTAATAYHDHNRLTKLDEIIAQLEGGADVALVSDAGTPCLSDPGWELVRACAERGLTVQAVPGAAAPLVALVTSGFAPYEFTFVGFPPRKKSELQAWCRRLRPEVDRRPLICFEAPHRLLATLELALAEWGDRPVAIARELTKLHEEIRRENLSASLEHFRQTEPRGEFTLVFAPNPAAANNPPEATSEAVIDPLVRLRELKAAGMRAKEAVEIVCKETSLPRRVVYDYWLKIS